MALTKRNHMNEDEFKKIKLLQSAKCSIDTAAKVTSWSSATVNYVYHADTLVEYRNKLKELYNRKLKKLPTKLVVKPEVKPKAEPDKLMTVLNNIASELSTINERLERLEEAHETKFSFFKR